MVPNPTVGVSRVCGGVCAAIVWITGGIHSRFEADEGSPDISPCRESGRGSPLLQLKR